MKIEVTKEWCMNMAKIEARAAELHEGCRMPMEQARALAASEAAPDWYARGQDWGLADALTNGQSGDWVLDDIARAFAAGAQAGGALESKRTHEVECQRVALEEQADLTAIHLARMQSALEQTGTRSADYLRKAIKAEAEVALLRAALNGGNVIERLQFALQRLADAAEALGVNNFGEDWRSDEVHELQAATHAARLVLGPNCYIDSSFAAYAGACCVCRR
jgi:Xaa-Pro aminopeptidase